MRLNRYKFYKNWICGKESIPTFKLIDYSSYTYCLLYIVYWIMNYYIVYFISTFIVSRCNYMIKTSTYKRRWGLLWVQNLTLLIFGFCKLLSGISSLQYCILYCIFYFVYRICILYIWDSSELNISVIYYQTTRVKLYNSTIQGVSRGFRGLFRSLKGLSRSSGASYLL